MNIRTLVLLVLISLSPVARLQAQPVGMKPVRPTVERQVQPVGVGVPHPAFGWALTPVSSNAHDLHQSAYRIVVAEAPAELLGHAPMWDSGRVEASTYWDRPYAGPSLHANTTYFWRVQVWSGGGRPGPWSETQRFTTALTSQDNWSGRWIAAEPDGPPAPRSTNNVSSLAAQDPPPLPVFRNDFSIIKPVKNAVLSVTGMGHYELHLNGHDVTTTVLNPGWTNYKKTVLYDTYDVASFLHPGKNTFGMLLGNGMYNVQGVKGHYTKFIGTFGQPKCLLQMDVTYADGSSSRFVTDSGWMTHAGPVLYSSTFGGETYDEGALPAGWDRPGFAATGWKPALEVSGPGGKLVANTTTPMVIAESFRPVRQTNPKPGVTVYDLGKNMSGWPGITVRGAVGDKVTLLAGELLNPDGTVSQRSANASPADPVLFRYVLRGGQAESWHPRFAYYSFRYVQVTTEPAGSGRPPAVLSLTGSFVHANVPVAGTFHSSNDLFDRIHTLIDRAVLSNLASVITDCPSREKLGWLEQTYLNASTLMLNYDVSRLYGKMTGDMLDAQLPSGLVPSTAPEYVAFLDKNGNSNAFRDSPEWGSALILSPWALYRLTGDLQPLSDGYEGMKRYAAYLKGQTRDGLLNFGLGDWYDIGPAPPGPSQLTSRSVTATGVYYEDLIALEKIASLLGHAEDAATYAAEAAQISQSYQKQLFHADRNEYDRGSQTAQAVPLALHLVPEDKVQGVLDHLIADIHAHGDHVTSGDIGFHYLVRALTDYGRSDVLAAMLSRTDSPSYGYQLAQGATTLTEAWDANPASSQNHFMLGHGEEWFYRGLAGLKVDMANGPENAIRLEPSLLPGVAGAYASYWSPMGFVSVEWHRDAAAAAVTVTVPAGAQAHLVLPSAVDWSAFPERSSHKTVGGVDHELTLGSGTYTFNTGHLTSRH